MRTEEVCKGARLRCELKETGGVGSGRLTGSPPEAKEMDCMWWLAIICGEKQGKNGGERKEKENTWVRWSMNEMTVSKWKRQTWNHYWENDRFPPPSSVADINLKVGWNTFVQQSATTGPAESISALSLVNTTCPVSDAWRDTCEEQHASTCYMLI